MYFVEPQTNLNLRSSNRNNLSTLASNTITDKCTLDFLNFFNRVSSPPGFLSQP